MCKEQGASMTWSPNSSYFIAYFCLKYHILSKFYLPKMHVDHPLKLQKYFILIWSCDVIYVWKFVAYTLNTIKMNNFFLLSPCRVLEKCTKLRFLDVSFLPPDDPRGCLPVHREVSPHINQEELHPLIMWQCNGHLIHVSQLTCHMIRVHVSQLTPHLILT